jgi:hypothetical protein
MKRSYSNPCIKCGRERVVVRTWTEEVYGSKITNTETRCPNPACQTEVDRDNKKSKDRHDALRIKSEQRARVRKVTLHDKKIAKLHKN